MKGIFDTNVIISWIRELKHKELLFSKNIEKYISSLVLTELWAGAKTRNSERIIEKVQKSFLKTRRVVTPTINNYIQIGQIISGFPLEYKSKIKNAGFINDIFIGINAVSIGAVLFTENKSDFLIIKEYIPGLKVEFV